MEMSELKEYIDELDNKIISVTGKTIKADGKVITEKELRKLRGLMFDDKDHGYILEIKGSPEEKRKE